MFKQESLSNLSGASKTSFAPIALMLVAMLLAGCEGLMRVIPGESTLQSGTEYMAQLEENGKLPGITVDTHGCLNSYPERIGSVSYRKYPQTIEYYFIPANKTNLVFWYEIRRENKKAPWNLIKAAQTSNDSTNVIELLSKSS